MGSYRLPAGISDGDGPLLTSPERGRRVSLRWLVGALVDALAAAPTHAWTFAGTAGGGGDSAMASPLSPPQPIDRGLLASVSPGHGVNKTSRHAGSAPPPPASPRQRHTLHLHLPCLYVWTGGRCANTPRVGG